MNLNTGRKQAQRLYPIAEDDVCDHCGLTVTLQRHHKDHNPMNNAPENIALLCVKCHGTEHKKIAQATCKICAGVFQPKRSRRSTICGKESCKKELGKISAKLRWA